MDFVPIQAQYVDSIIISLMNQIDYSASFQIFAVVEKHSQLHKTVCILEKYVDYTNKILQAKGAHFTTLMKPML